MLQPSLDLPLVVIKRIKGGESKVIASYIYKETINYYNNKI